MPRFSPKSEKSSGKTERGVKGSACVAGAYCDQTAKKYAAQVAAGAACTDSGQCATARCEEGKCIPSNAAADDDTRGN